MKILKSISQNIDLCEIGFPHSTPIGDGGKIQTSSYRSIKNGFKMKDAFQIVKNYKKIKNSKPVILMGYYNMIYQYGENRFLKNVKILELMELFVLIYLGQKIEVLQKNAKKICKLCATFISNYIQRKDEKIIKDSHEMCYYISMLSTTGGKLKVSPRVIFKKLRKNKKD